MNFGSLFFIADYPDWIRITQMGIFTDLVVERSRCYHGRLLFWRMEKTLQFGDLTQATIGCAMKVHSYFGSGFHEAVYQRSMIIELRGLGLDCSSEVEKKVMYENQLVGKRRLDIIVENKVLLELKVLGDLNAACFSRMLNYLKVFDLEVGLLLNFGTDRLQFKRVVRSKHLRHPL